MVAILEGKIVLSQWRLPFNMAAITMEKINNARPLLLLTDACSSFYTPRSPRFQIASVKFHGEWLAIATLYIEDSYH